MAIRAIPMMLLCFLHACMPLQPPVRPVDCAPGPAPSARTERGTLSSLVAPAASAPASTELPPLLAVPADPEPPQLGKVGDLTLESGATLHDCRVEYRIIGAANADRSNIVVWATWFSGTTKDLVELVGPGKLVDSTKYRVVLVGALGNGASSSPSNSPAQPRLHFPVITIRDMVESQHRLLTQVLGLAHVRAVMGISMGGMQTFQWGISYPLFMDRLIPIVGSPRLAPYDLVLWQASLGAVQQDPAYQGGNYREQPVLPVVQQLVDLNLTTPAELNRRQTREAQLAQSLAPPRFDANDRVRQLQAMMSHDVSKPFGGSLDAAAKTVKAKLLVVVNEHDAMVTPGPALEFAKLANAPSLVLEGDCGHKATSCEEAAIGARIRDFLK